MRKPDFSRYAPAGADLQPQRRTFMLGAAAAWLYSLGFVFRCIDARSMLYTYNALEGRRILRGDAVMPDFVQLLDKALLGFGFLALVMLGFSIFYYAYHRQGSRSIYLMRRLPDRWELHRRCLTLPLLGALCCIVMAVLLVMLYYGLYRLLTPEQCFRPGQWEMIWRMFS